MKTIEMPLLVKRTQNDFIFNTKPKKLKCREIHLS